MDGKVIVIFASVLSVALGSSCSAGYCSLDEDPEKCTIQVDSLCSIMEHCNGNGHCFKDMGVSGVFCNCTDNRFGETCQYVYKSDLAFVCHSDEDCGGASHGACGLTGKCICEVGFRGDSCEIETRVIVEDQNICKNGGIPYKQGISYGCVCRCGFVEHDCSKLSYPALSHASCHTKICNGNGYCISGEDVCVCNAGFGGKYCEYAGIPTTTEKSVNQTATESYIPCTEYGDNRCKNGGLCDTDSAILAADHKCICPPDYRGNFCEIEINPYNTTEICNSKKRCFNGGVCGGTKYGKKCFCECGYFGTYCEYSTDPQRFDYRDQCEAQGHSCLNGGSCIIDEQTCDLTCSCPPEFSGEYCELQVTTTQDSLACEHIYENGCATLQCYKNLVCVTDQCGAAHCVYSAPVISGSPPYLAATASAAFVAFVIVAACVIFWFKRHRRHALSSSRASPRVSYIHSAVVYNRVRAGQNSPNEPTAYLQLTVSSFDGLPTYDQACNSPPAYCDIAETNTGTAPAPNAARARSSAQALMLTISEPVSQTEPLVTATPMSDKQSSEQKNTEPISQLEPVVPSTSEGSAAPRVPKSLRRFLSAPEGPTTAGVSTAPIVPTPSTFKVPKPTTPSVPVTPRSPTTTTRAIPALLPTQTAAGADRSV